MMSLDLTTLLIVSSIVSLAFAGTLLASNRSLGDAGASTGTWVAAEMVSAFARSALLVGFLPGAMAAWAQLFGPWKQHGLAVALYLVAEVLQYQALAGQRGQSAFLPRNGWMIAAAAGCGWLALTATVDDDDIRHRVGLTCIGLTMLAPLIAAWPLARVFWGGRLIFGTCLLGALVTLPRGLSGALEHVETNLTTVFIFELIAAVFRSMGFLLLLQERLRDRILQYSITDMLTGARNRRGISEAVDRELAIAARRGHPVSLVLFDLDHFKAVNDRFGHAVGDSVLKGLVIRIRAVIRQQDTVGRWGGEEFLLLLPELNAEDAVQVAERVRLAVRGELLAEGAPSVTVSAGVAQAPATLLQAAENRRQAIDEWLNAADRRMYVAKNRRDCVVGDGPTAIAAPCSPASSRVVEEIKPAV
jgi:diguanylate cyclase (GGDEF)-like protein